MAPGVRTAALSSLAALAALAVVACREVPRAEAARTSYAQIAADSAHADSAAFDALPDALGAMLDVRGLLEDPPSAPLALSECLVLDERREGELRRRLRLKLADSSTVVLYAAADRTSGALERVEFVRRTPREGQRGILWDGAGDRTTSVWWTETDRGIRRPDRGPIPRGGPVPRALRALGRQLLTIPCADSSSVPPPLPPRTPR